MFQKIARTLIYMIVFLIPLFTLPFTANPLDSAKQFLFLLLVVLALFFWVWGMVVQKKVVIKYNWTYALVLAFLAIMLVASIFSAYPYGSFWGSPLSIADSFVTLLGFSLLYFLAVNLFDKKQIKNLIIVAAISGALAGLYAFFQSFGLYLVPFGYAKNASFNTVGTASGLMFYLAILLPAVLPLLLSCKEWEKWVLIACAAIFSLDLITFNATLAWFALAIGLLAAFLFEMSSDEFAKRFRSARAISFAFLAVAIVFASIDFFASDVFSNAYSAIYKQIGFIGQPAEVYLSQGATSKLASDTVRQSAKTFFLGSGPGTFVYDYEKQKPAAIAQNANFWNVEFTTGASQVLDLFATTGFLGLLAFLVLVIYVTFKGFKMLTEDKVDNNLALAIFSGWLASLAMVFLYPLTFTGLIVFWLFLAILGIAGSAGSKTYELNSIKAAYFASLAMIVLLIAQIGFVVWVSKRYYAEVKYLQAVNELQKNNIDGAINNLGLASMSVQDMQDNYLTSLAQLYLGKANQLNTQANQQNNANSKDAGNTIATYIAQAVKVAQLATDKVNPNNVANWSVRGYILTQLAAAGVSGDPASLAQKSFQKAIDLEPSNPSLWLQMGQVMLIKNDLAGAKTDFQKAVDLNSNYSDARYYLGLIDDQQGDKKAAIDQFNIILQLNPDNKTITQILDNLQAGKPALGEAQPAQSTPAASNLPVAPVSLQEQQTLPGALPANTPQGDNSQNTTPAPAPDTQSSPSGSVQPGSTDQNTPTNGTSDQTQTKPSTPIKK